MKRSSTPRRIRTSVFSAGTGRDALALYERNWRFVDERSLEPQERELIGRLAHAYGGGLLNV
jgi:hypothetical protein